MILLVIDGQMSLRGRSDTRAISLVALISGCRHAILPSSPAERIVLGLMPSASAISPTH